jgi:hypothetical protein
MDNTLTFYTDTAVTLLESVKNDLSIDSSVRNEAFSYQIIIDSNIEWNKEGVPKTMFTFDSCRISELLLLGVKLYPSKPQRVLDLYIEYIEYECREALKKRNRF